MKTITINFPGGSLLDIRKKYNNFYDQSWYDEQPFASVKVPKGKWTVGLEVVPDSFSNSWDEQQALLPANAVVPPAAVLAFALIQDQKKTKNWSLTNMWLRCSDTSADGARVYVGVDSGGVGVYSDWGSGRYSGLGLAAAWKGDLKPGKLGAFEDSGLSREEALKLVEDMEEVIGEFKTKWL